MEERNMDIEDRKEVWDWLDFQSDNWEWKCKIPSETGGFGVIKGPDPTEAFRIVIRSEVEDTISPFPSREMAEKFISLGKKAFPDKFRDVRECFIEEIPISSIPFREREWTSFVHFLEEWEDVYTERPLTPEEEEERIEMLLFWEDVERREWRISKEFSEEEGE